jgi:hypothetical protein
VTHNERDGPSRKKLRNRQRRKRLPSPDGSSVLLVGPQSSQRLKSGGRRSTMLRSQRERRHQQRRRCHQHGKLRCWRVWKRHERHGQRNGQQRREPEGLFHQETKSSQAPRQDRGVAVGFDRPIFFKYTREALQDAKAAVEKAKTVVESRPSSGAAKKAPVKESTPISKATSQSSGPKAKLRIWRESERPAPRFSR